jgi:hypothetical protein
MDRTAGQSHRRSTAGAGPQVECRECRLPMLLTFVTIEGEHRSIDCPFCGHHDEWTVPAR